jgi:hypothetical protein
VHDRRDVQTDERRKQVGEGDDFDVGDERAPWRLTLGRWGAAVVEVASSKSDALRFRSRADCLGVKWPT